MGWNLSQGFVNMYSKSSQSYSADYRGGASMSSSEDLKDGFNGTEFRWTSPTGNYNFNVSWGISFRVTANDSTSLDNCDANASWFLRTIATPYNQNTRGDVVSGNQTYTVANGSLLDKCGTYSMTVPWESFFYNVPGGVWLVDGDWYQPSSQIWLHTAATSGQSSNGDVAIDVWSTTAQANYAQFDNYEISRS